MDRKIIFSQKGFGVLEVLLMVALVGGLSYFVMDQRDKASKFQARSEFDLEVENAATLFRQFFADTYTCSRTVEPASVGVILGPPTPPGVERKGDVSGGDITKITEGLFNSAFPTAPGSRIFVNGRDLLERDKIIKPGFKVSKINVVFNGVEDMIRVKFAFEGNKASKTGILKEINRDFRLITKKISTPSGDKITECFLKISQADLIRGCTKLQGDWDAALQKCVMRDYILRSRDLVNLYDNGSGGYTLNSPVRGTMSCTCPMTSCQNIPGPTCCRPNPCNSSFFTEHPARLVKTATTCRTEARCYDKPIGHLVKGP